MEQGQVSADRLTINVLGPLTVTCGTKDVPVGPGMVRNLLGLLALHAGTTVSRDDIVETLWDGEPPATYPNLIQGYVSRLRAQLRDGASGGDDDAIVNTKGGYRLNVGDDAVDLARFDRLLRDARSSAKGTDLAAAADRYEMALRCWRGPVLADLDQRFERLPPAVAANDRQATAAVEYGRLCCRLGRYGPAIDLLRTVAKTAPLHEALHGQLMMLLAADGNRAASFALYDEIRRRLADQLGVDPGPELQELHLQLLRQGAPERSSAAPIDPGGTNPVVEPPPAPRRSARSWTRGKLAVAALLGVLLVAVGISLARGSATGKHGAAGPTASGSASPTTYTTPVNWDWGYGPVAITPGSEQWAAASVSGLTKQGCAGFRLRTGSVPKLHEETNGFLVAVCQDKWEIEGPEGDFEHIEYPLATAGLMRVTVSATNILTITFNGAVVVTRTLNHRYPKRGIAPVIYQGDTHVVMTDVQWNGVPKYLAAPGSQPAPSPTR